MRNDELPQAGGFPDDKISQYLRNRIGLPEEWRAWYFEALRPGGVLIRGSLCRPIAKHETDNGTGWTAIRPLQMRKERTLTNKEYGELVG